MSRTKRAVPLVIAAACVIALFSLCAPAAAYAAEYGYQPIEKVLATTSTVPVASQNAYDISGATSTSGAYFYGISWYDSAGQYIDGAFTTDYATVNIRLDAAPGYYFADGLAAYLNNSPVDYVIYDGGSYIILTRTYTPELWAPTVIKHPGGETVDEGGWCSFVATASGADKCEWRIQDANGQLYTMTQLVAAYPAMTYSDDTFGKLIIRSIPRQLDGAKVYCTFSGAGGSVDTNAASLKVNYEKPSPTPSPTPTPTPTAAPSPSASPNAGGTGSAAGTDADHEHSYSREWKHDDEHHWHECECGDRADEAAHVMSWTETREATKKQPGEEAGECGVCDSTTTREVEYVKPAESGRWILYVGIGAVALVVILMVLSAVKQKRAARLRRAARRRRYYDDE